MNESESPVTCMAYCRGHLQVAYVCIVNRHSGKSIGDLRSEIRLKYSFEVNPRFLKSPIYESLKTVRKT